MKIASFRYGLYVSVALRACAFFGPLSVDSAEAVEARNFALPEHGTDGPRQAANPSLPGGILTLGGRSHAEGGNGFVDVLTPVVGNDRGFIFLDPRASVSDEGQNEENVGLGARKLIFNENAILGANIFYDNRETSHSNRFNQMGLGLELLTEWFDARANYYLPENGREWIAQMETQGIQIEQKTEYGPTYFEGHEVKQDGEVITTTTTTTHHFDKFETASEGWDVELGIKVPFVAKIAETRVYGGYYGYNADFGKDIEGFKARIEVRALPGLIFDAEWYEDKALKGTEYYVGARVRLPFEIGNLFRGKNPFEGAGEYFKRRAIPLKERMTDMVIRDMDIIVEESPFIEDAKKLKVEEEIEEDPFTDILLSDITFVDGDNTGNEDGTYEHPFNLIQEGVNNAFGAKYVHVQDAGASYKENVSLRNDVILWGSGCKVFGHESGIRPVVDGRSQGPSITMADNSQIRGMEVINTDTGGVAQNRTIAGETYDIRRIGIYAENKTNLNISCNNDIHDNEVGVLLAADTVTNFSSTIKASTMRNNQKEGLRILGQGSSGTFSLTMDGNNISDNNTLNNAFDGARIQGTNYSTATADITNNDFNNNGDIRTTDGSAATAGAGLDLTLSTTSGDITVTVSKNEAASNGEAITTAGGNATRGEGIKIQLDSSAGAGKITATISDNTANDNGLAQALSSGDAKGVAAALLFRSGGIDVSITAGSGSVAATYSRNTTNNNGVSKTSGTGNARGGQGFSISLGSTQGEVNLAVTDNTAKDNGLGQAYGSGQATGGGAFLSSLFRRAALPEQFPEIRRMATAPLKLTEPVRREACMAFLLPSPL